MSEALTLPELLEQIEAAVTGELTGAAASVTYRRETLADAQADLDRACAAAAQAGWPPARIAEHIGMSASNVSTRIRRHNETGEGS